MTTAGCTSCGCYARGLQDAVWETYLVNIATTAAREELQRLEQHAHETTPVARWHE